MDDHWSELTIFEGESADALKTRFVELSVQYPRHTALQVTQFLFKDLQEPTRYMQAAALWGGDLELFERIRLLELKGPPVPDASESDLVRRALAIADSTMVESRDKLNAIRLAGELQGFVKKSVDTKITTPGNDNNAALLAAIAEKLRA